MSDKAREKELQAQLSQKAAQESVKQMSELLNIRLERYKNSLISIGCDMTRGRAQEAKELLKFLEQSY